MVVLGWVVIAGFSYPGQAVPMYEIIKGVDNVPS